MENQASSQPLYAIVGTSHHSKGGKDKLARAVRGFLDEWKYSYREFSISGDRGNNGGILGINPSSFDKSMAAEGIEGGGGGGGGGGAKTRGSRSASGGSASTSSNGKKDRDRDTMPRGPGKKK